MLVLQQTSVDTGRIRTVLHSHNNMRFIGNKSRGQTCSQYLGKIRTAAVLLCGDAAPPPKKYVQDRDKIKQIKLSIV